MPEAVRILLVEDDDDDAELALRALARSEIGPRVVRARDGEEALDVLLGRGPFEGREVPRPALVLLDLKLPKVDGIEVLRRFRADGRARGVPVVVLTSSMLPADVRACYEAGANGFVVKQVEFAEHARTLQQIADYWLRINVRP
ncbi:MAG: response regulator [Thermoanaerobaculia bacterium]|nr:response regulator [Thermoanaerobaculia bacterium]